MKLHLYKIVLIDEETTDAYSIVESVKVVNEDGLRENFLNVLNNGGFCMEELLDYAKDPNYSKENWEDMGNLSVDTMADMLNDIVNYGGAYYVVMDLDLNTKD